MKFFKWKHSNTHSGGEAPSSIGKFLSRHHEGTANTFLDNQKKDQTISELQSRTRRCNHALRVMQGAETSTSLISEVISDLLANMTEESIS